MRRSKAGMKQRQRADSKPDLPLTVTSVEPQKKRSGRFSLYHENKFILGVSSETLTRFHLGTGSVITAGLYEKIREAEESRSCKDYLLRLLGRRDHGAHEIRLKAIQKGYDGETIDPVIEELLEKGYLNDESFARKFASDKLHLKHWGPEKIKAKLAEKGIDKNTSENVLSSIAEDLELSQICVDLVLRRRRHFSRENDDFKRKQKIAAYLQQKGFPFETINQTLPEIISRLNV